MIGSEGTGPTGAADGAGRRGGPGWSLRTRVFVVVGLSAVPAVLGAVVGTAALASVNAKVSELDRRSVQTLVALADLRDAQGEMRVLTNKYIAAGPQGRSDLIKEIRSTDARADAGIAAFRAAHGSTTDAEGLQTADFVAKLATWRTIRDEQVVAPADNGDKVSARAALGDVLEKADAAMAEPLDRVFEKERADATRRVDAARNAYVTARAWVAILIAAGLALTAVVAWLLIRRPVALLRRITDVVADGRLEARVGETDGTDVGRLGESLDRLLTTIRQQRDDLATQQAARERQLASTFARQQEAEKEVRARAQAVIDETGTAVLTELQGVLEQAEAVRAASAEIDARVCDADSMTHTVVERAGTADQVVSAVTDSLRRVAGIAQLIAGVAEQTNLLALNATIEAARAGEAGRGFSVVANEVKELAAETGRSTGEIGTTVGALEADASAMATTIQEMAHGVGTMGEATARVSEVVARQRESVAQLDVSVREAMARITAMSQLTSRLERRQARRVAIQAAGAVRWDGRDEQCEILDLSETGLRLWLDGTLPVPGDEVSVDVVSDGYTATLRGRVVRIEDGDPAHEVGVLLGTLPADERARLQAYLSALTSL